MSKLYSKEDINIDKRLGYCEDALNEVFERLENLEKLNRVYSKKTIKSKKEAARLVKESAGKVSK